MSIQSPPVFELRDLTKRYKKRTVVNHLSFSGSANKIVGFLGPNGAGKTTTIRMMTGLSPINSGSAAICGHNIQKELEAALAHVGAIVETPSLYNDCTGMENLRLFAKIKNCTSADVDEMAELSGLKERLDDKVSAYSLGMKQRLGISTALLGKPSLLILDEPTNGLDPLAIRNLRAFLKKLSHEDGVCVLISSHMLWEMEKLCDRVVIINEGNFLGEADISKLRRENTNLEDYYVSCVEAEEGEQ